MEVCVVLFNPRIHLVACTQPFVSNTFDWNVLFVYKHSSTALCFKHVWIVGPCLCTCISVQPFVSNTFDCGFLFVYPPAHTKMKVTPELEKISHRARAPSQLSIFLEKEQLFGLDDAALGCTKEELLDETLVAPAKAGGVPCDSLAEKVCIKKSLGLVQGGVCNGAPWSTCIPDGGRRPSTS